MVVLSEKHTVKLFEKRLSSAFEAICPYGQRIIQKKYGHIGFWQSQKRLQLGMLGEGPGQCLGEGVGAKPPNNFQIKHTKMMIARVNIR